MAWLRRCIAMIGLAAAGCGRVAFDPLEEVSPEIASPPEARTMVAVGEFHACALTGAGSLACWGANFEGEAGVGDYVPRFSPVRVGGEGMWRHVDVGASHSCGIDGDGAPWCWGSNSGGQVGVGDYAARVLPARIAVPGVVVALSMGSYAAHASTGGGTRWAWGDNRGSGDLGTGNGEGPVGYPTIALGTAWTRIGAGYIHACALRGDGELWCWGDNTQGKLGLGDTQTRWEPTQVLPATRFAEVSSGQDHTCAVRADGALLCWGSSANGALGDGALTFVEVRVPQPVVSTRSWRAVSAGADATCAIDVDGGLWCFGVNTRGQLGVDDTTARRVPTEVLPGSRWLAVDVSGTGNQTCGVQSDATVWCWGYNSDGQLGLGDQLDRRIPTRVTLPP